MKKVLSLALALVFCTSVAFGQGADLAKVAQFDGASATITQGAGENQVIGISPDKVFTQEGAGYAIARQSGGATLKAEQLGMHNYFESYQWGNSQTSINQVTTPNAAWKGNSAYVEQGGDGHMLSIDQQGQGNRAQFRQDNPGADGSEATILQTGNGNIVEGFDAVSNPPGIRHTFGGAQSGTYTSLQTNGDQFLDLKQNDGSKLYLYQSGDVALGENSVRLDQDAGYAQIGQRGNGNAVSGVAAGATDMASQEGASLFLLQDGSNNNLHFEQSSLGSEIDLVQTGNANAAVISQN